MVSPRRTLALSLVVLSVAGISTFGLSAPANAAVVCAPASGAVIDGITYDLAADCTAMVTGGTPVDGKISIPSAVTSTLDTYSVTSIGDSAFENALTLTSLALPSSLTSMGNFAFAHTGLSGALDLSSLTSLTTMLRRAFSFNWGLTSVILPSSLTTIGNSFFWDTHITSATFRGPLPTTDSNPLFPPGAIVHYCGADHSSWHGFTVVPECSLDFSTGEGTSVVTATVAYGSLFTLPTPPTREGYNFSGWVTSPDGTTPFAFTAVAVTNATAYASWVSLSPAPATGDEPAEIASTGLDSAAIGSVAALLLGLGVMSALGAMIARVRVRGSL